MHKLISSSFIFIIVLGIVLSLFSLNSILNYSDYGINENTIYTSSNGYTWPIPNFYKISSYFGSRPSPTSYSSSFHRGIDIPALENTYFLASISANVIYTGFRGSGGYTIILEKDNVQIMYYHVSPNFLVNVRRFC